MTSPSLTVTSPAVNERAVDLDRLGADDGRRAPAAGDDGGVADEPAAGGEDALGDHHPVDVLRAGLVAHEDDLLAALGGVVGVVGGEVHLADRGARRRGQPLGDDLARPGELRVQHLVEVVGRRRGSAPPPC